MLGSDLAAAARQRGWLVHCYDLPEFDITDRGAIQQVVRAGTVVVNCAAYTNVEKAESEPELANRVNGLAVGWLGQAAKSVGAYVLHISTDFVFDGNLDRSYRETDQPNPLSAYGRSKWAGEQALAASGCSHCIVRVQWTYGRHGVHFIKKLLEAASAGKPLKVVEDQIGSPTWTADAAAALCDMLALAQLPQGVYHLAASGYVSRYHMAQFIFQTLGRAVEIAPCKSSDFPTAAKRPLNSCFDCSKLQQLLGRPLRSWQEMLKEFLTIYS